MSSKGLSTLRIVFPAGVIRHRGLVAGAWVVHPPREPLARRPTATVLLRVGGELVAYALDSCDPGLVGTSATSWFEDADGPRMGTPYLPSSALSEFLGLGLVTHMGAFCLTSMRAIASVARPDLPKPTDGDVDGRMRGIAAEVAPFVETLDQRAVAMAREACLPDVMMRAWDGLDATLGTGAPLRRVMCEVPEFAWTLLEAWDGARVAIAAHVARGDATAAVRAALGRDWPPRILGAIPGYVHARRWHEAVGSVDVNDILRPRPSRKDRATHELGPLRHLSGDHVPRTDDDWRGFRAATETLQVTLALHGGGRLPGLVGPVADWNAWMDAASTAAGTDWHGLPGAVRDTCDLERAYARQVVEPAMALCGATTGEVGLGSMSEALTRGRTLRSILECSHRWHRALPRLAAAMTGLSKPGDPDAPWGAGLPDAEVLGCAIRILNTEGALVAEGGSGPDDEGAEGLRHCVGGYADACRSGRTRIASVRDAVTGARLSTVAFDASRPVPVAVQHRGRRNGAPPARAVQAIEAYEAMLRDGRLAVEAAQFVRVSVPSRSAAGYDAEDPAQWEAVAKLWDPFLPRRLRAHGPEALVGVVAGFDPMAGVRVGRATLTPPTSP